MEVFAQYLDNLEDLAYAFLLKAERLRQACLFLLSALTTTALVVLCVVIALHIPPLAAAFATLFGVGMLYRSVVSGPAGRRSPV